MTNLILCGGAGTRLWPLSRQSRPKQFVPLFGGKSIFQETIERNREVADRFYLASNEVQMQLARNQLVEIGNPVADFLIEPVGRNTAPAIALVCLALPPEELVFVTPSDHRITRPDEYFRAVERAKQLAKEGFLVTFGITPTYPETGFGYIECEGEAVLSFREKPELTMAQIYVASGRHLWNSGMFLFRADLFLSELERYSPQVLNACRQVKTNQPTHSEMQAIPSISIDYAVLEHSDRVRVVPFDPGWSDLGSFDALGKELPTDSSGNSVLGPVTPILVEAQNNLVIASGRKVALVDVDGYIVVDTPDALLIVKKGSTQKVTDVVESLKKANEGLLD